MERVQRLIDCDPWGMTVRPGGVSPILLGPRMLLTQPPSPWV
jgi:hypothetical protein